jgi:hypothetical protein
LTHKRLSPSLVRMQRRPHPNPVVLAAGTFAVLGGALTLLGWGAGIQVLTSWEGNNIAMFANPAVCAVLSGGALLCMLRPARTRRWVSAIVGLVVLTIGLLTLLEHLGGFNFAIDTLIANRPWGQSGTSSPMRMGPPASASFTLLGAAFLLSASGRGRARMLASVLGLAVTAIPLFSLVGYLHGAAHLYGLPRLTGIALQTATIIFAIAVGLIAAIPEEGVASVFMQLEAGAVVRRWLGLVFVIPIAVGLLSMAGQRAGFFDLPTGTAMRTLAEILLLFGVLLWTASGLRHGEAISRQQENELRRELAASAVLQRVSAHLVAGGDFQSLHEHIVDAAVALLHADGGSLQVLVTDRGAPSGGSELRLLASRGLPAAGAIAESVPTSLPTSAGEAFRRRRRCVVPDIDTCSWLAGSEELAHLRASSIRSIQSTPLVSRAGNLLGTLSTVWRPPHTPDGNELRWLASVRRPSGR